MMNATRSPRMDVPRYSNDDFTSHFANGYNMMGTIMDGIRARNDRNRLQKLLKGVYGDGEGQQQAQELTPQRGERVFSVGEVPDDNSFGSVFGQATATPVVNQKSQPDYSMQNFMRSAINSGMLPSNAMAAYGSFIAPLEQKAREDRIRENYGKLAYRNNGLSTEELLKARAELSQDLAEDYGLKDISALTDLLSKQYSGLLQPLGLMHDPEDYKQVGITINPNAWNALGNTIGVNYGNNGNNFGNNNVSMGGSEYGGDNENARAIYTYLKGKGLPDNVIAGIMGNLQAESQFNPAIGYGDGGTSGGLAQWHDEQPGVGRWSNLKNFAVNRQMDWKDLGTQLDFMVDEINKNYPDLIKKMSSLSPNEAAILFHDTYERSKDNPEQKARRGTYADEIFNGRRTLGNGAGNVGFSQTDGRWSDTPYAGGTIGTSGCAPTTMANFLQKFGVNATPADVAKFSSENGFANGKGGTSWGMFTAAGNNFGVPVHQTGNWSDVVNALKTGQPVMAGHDPGKFTSDPNSGSGHWLMYNGITPDGKITVVDANNGKKSGVYSVDEVRSDWERNNPVAFIANNKNAVPVQQTQQVQQQVYNQPRQSFANHFAPQVVSGQGAILNPMALYKATVDQAERQRQQDNANREFNQKVFDNNRNYELNVGKYNLEKQRIDLLKQNAEAKQKQEDLSKYQLYSYDELYKEGSPISTLNNLITSPLKEDATDEQKKQYQTNMLNAVNSFAQYNVQKYKDLIAKGYNEQDAQTILRNGIANAVGRSFMASQGGNSDAKKYMIEKAVSDIYYRTMDLVAQDKESLSKPSSTGSFKMLNDANYSSDKLNEIAGKSKQNVDDKELNHMVKKAKLEDKLKQLIKDDKYNGLYLEREGENLKIKMGRGITRNEAEPKAKELRRLAEEYAKEITNEDVVKYKNEVEEMKRKNKQYQELVNSQYLSDAEAHQNFNNADDELVNNYLKHAETSYSW